MLVLTLVTVLEPDGEADGVLHAVAAPGGSDAALDGAQRLTVSVSGFQTSRAQLGPDGRQLYRRGNREVGYGGESGKIVELLFSVH